MQIEIYHKFRNVSFAFMLEHNYLVLYVLFYCDYFVSKFLWRKELKKKEKKTPRGPGLRPALFFPPSHGRARPSSSSPRPSKPRPSQGSRRAPFSFPLWPTAGPCPFSHCDVGPTRQCSSFFLRAVAEPDSVVLPA